MREEPDLRGFDRQAGGSGMRVYHGSMVVVEKPLLLAPNLTLDFGPGFYTATNEDQARSFARKVYERALPARPGAGRFVSIYQVDYERLEKELSALRFTFPDAAWFDFVWANRRGRWAGRQYDAIHGPVANDTIYRCLIGYEAGLFSREETIERLKTRRLYDQMAFATEKALSFLHYEGYEEARA
jgi:hypothetical protein